MLLHGTARSNPRGIERSSRSSICATAGLHTAAERCRLTWRLCYGDLCAWVASGEYAFDLGEREPARAQQREQVEHQVGAFVEQAGVVAGDGGECDLDGFLADLLRDLRGAGLEQLRGVAAFAARRR